MNGYYTQLYKLSKQLQHVTPELNIENPYTRIIERVGNKYHPSIKILYEELLKGIVRLHNVHSVKGRIQVSREDLLITLSLMKNLLLPLQPKPCNDSSIETYGLLWKHFGESTEFFGVKEVCKYSQLAKRTINRHLKALTDSKIIERIEGNNRNLYRIIK